MSLSEPYWAAERGICDEYLHDRRVGSYGGVDTAVEALVLYDGVYLDGPSLDRNCRSDSSLTKLVTECGDFLIPLDLTCSEEDAVYRRIVDNYLGVFTSHCQQGGDFLGMLPETVFSDLRCRQVAPCSAPPAYVVNLAGYAEVAFNEIRKLLSQPPRLGTDGAESDSFEAHANEPSGGPSRRLHSPRPRGGDSILLSGEVDYLAVAVLRALYYYQLQHDRSLDLILHPLRSTFVETRSPASNIIHFFDESVRASFYERKNRWFGSSDLLWHVPMLTTYVMRRCGGPGPQRLGEVIGEVRDSKEARYFRQGIEAIEGAVTDRDNERLDRILTDLERAGKDWSRSLSVEGTKRTISVTLPIVNLGSQLQVPDLKLHRSPSEKMLVFVHQLLCAT